MSLNAVDQRPVETVDADVVELAGDRAVNRQLLVGRIEQMTVAPVLLAYVAQSIFGAAFLHFVQCDQVGEVEHVDFFQLGRRTELAGHDVEREITDLNNPCIALTDTAGFDDDQVKRRPP